jgi:hypothetical protein
MKYLILILFSIAFLSGCSQGAKSSSYPSVVAWNNILYGLSAEEVPVQDIGKEIGKIERRSTPMPKKNGESNDKPAGSLLFEVKGTDSQELIAVKVNDKYFRASKQGALK